MAKNFYPRLEQSSQRQEGNWWLGRPTRNQASSTDRRLQEWATHSLQDPIHFNLQNQFQGAEEPLDDSKWPRIFQLGKASSSSGIQHCPRHFRQPSPEDCRNTEYLDVLVIDTGGGKYPTITDRSCQDIEISGQATKLLRYGSAGPDILCHIANVLIKAHFPNRNL
jgi:hypothetical protein